jgi:hypothetical protein
LYKELFITGKYLSSCGSGGWSSLILLLENTLDEIEKVFNFNLSSDSTWVSRHLRKNVPKFTVVVSKLSENV